jgi:hypothetical protein
MDFDQTPRTEPATVEYYDDFTGYLNSDNESDEDKAARGVESLVTPMKYVSISSCLSRCCIESTSVALGLSMPLVTRLELKG